MRPIDADALMEKLNGIWDCNDMTFAPVDGCSIDADCKSCRWRETIEYVKRLVQNQPTASPWHRVESKEDLPKKSNTYIVYLRQGTKVETPEWMGGEPLSYVTEMGFDKEQMLWKHGDDAYNAILSAVDTKKDFHVTHWTEMPEPPKEIMNE